MRDVAVGEDSGGPKSGGAATCGESGGELPAGELFLRQRAGMSQFRGFGSVAVRDDGWREGSAGPRPAAPRRALNITHVSARRRPRQPSTSRTRPEFQGRAGGSEGTPHPPTAKGEVGHDSSSPSKIESSCVRSRI